MLSLETMPENEPVSLMLVIPYSATGVIECAIVGVHIAEYAITGSGAEIASGGGAQAEIADRNAAHREHAASAGGGSHGVARGAVEIPLIQERYGRGVAGSRTPGILRSPLRWPASGQNLPGANHVSWGHIPWKRTGDPPCE